MNSSTAFADETDILLEVDSAIRVRVDMSLKVQTFESGADGFTATAVRAGQERAIPAESLKLVDWQDVYLDLLQYKAHKGLRNLAIRPDTPRAILATAEPSRLYSLIADDTVVKPDSFAGTGLLQEAVLSILKKYIDKFYRVQEERWNRKHMIYKLLNENDPNFQDYTIKVARGEAQLIAAIQKLIEEGDRIYEQKVRELPTIHFDRHLYQPLLVEQGDKVRSKPRGLKESECQFVDDLRAYCHEEKDKSLADTEVFLRLYPVDQAWGLTADRLHRAARPAAR